GGAGTSVAVDSKDYQGDAALTVWSAAAALGSPSYQPIIWGVRPPLGAAGALAYLEVYAQDEASTYTVNMNEVHSVIGHIGLPANVTFDLQRLRNHFYVL